MDLKVFLWVQRLKAMVELRFTVVDALLLRSGGTFVRSVGTPDYRATRLL